MLRISIAQREKMYFIEAKKTNPKETTAESTEEKKAKYNAYISDITTKMRHSLAVYASILLRRYDFEGVPEDMQKRDLSHIEITLLLVVKEAEPQWLIPLQDKLNKELKKDTAIWRNVNLCVINEDKAREKHFVT